MPLFNYRCVECELIVEKFQHKPEEVDIECEECGGIEFERVFGIIYNKTKYSNAKEIYKNRIAPDVERIQNNIAKGSDKDFLDITGD